MQEQSANLTTFDDYQRKGLLGRVGFGTQPALLIVDVQTGFTDPACPLGSDFDDEIEAIRHLLKIGRQRGVLTVFTRVEYGKGLTDGGWFVKKVPSLRHLEQGSKWTVIDPRVAPQNGSNEHVVVKKYASAFFGTSLASLLSSSGCDTVIIAGFTTSGCVRATAVDALQHGFRPIVVRQAVGDRADGPHDANLFDLHAKYADVLDLAEVAKYLTNLADDETRELGPSDRTT